MSTIRCAIYTRKSTEEGLDMQFNSLDAQREACEAYIASQKHEGWKVLPKHYDDGGFSGGNLQRPALQALLTDIALGKIDLVVVYKIDRLTRSLTDFAKMVEVFDKHQTSFVSVTQHFNTTTSMGRLTLNVLLSFAQFEREVTGERIRDKIAASKKKGLWMGGNIPLGYDVQDKALVINPKEAEQVRSIFRRYLEIGSVDKLKDELDQQGIHSKARKDREGKPRGGVPFTRGALYWLLQNRCYLGQVTHGEKSYQGQHEAIIPKDLWDKVQVQLDANRRKNKLRITASSASLLAGMLYLQDGTRLTPIRTDKRGKRYRYYGTIRSKADNKGTASKISLPAYDLETLVEREWKALLTSKELQDRLATKPETAADITRQLKELAGMWDALPTAEKIQHLQDAHLDVRVSTDRITLSANPEGIFDRRIHPLSKPSRRKKSDPITRTIHASIYVSRGEKKIVEPDSHVKEKDQEAQREQILRRIALGRAWANELIEGKIGSTKELAERENMSESYIYDVLRSGCLSPNIVVAIENEQRHWFKLDSLKSPLPFSWDKQFQGITKLHT